MSERDFWALSPLIALSLSGVLVMLVVAVRRSHLTSLTLSAMGLLVAGACLVPASRESPRAVTPLLLVDPVAVVYLAIILGAALVVVAVSYGYLKARTVAQDEYYVLLLLGTLGAGVLVLSQHFASLLLGLGVVSIALYGLIAYTYTNPRSLEASYKYLILTASSTALLLFGTALVYFELGTLGFHEVGVALQDAGHHRPRILGGLCLVLVGLGLELGSAPFFQWVPDVYEGAPAPVTGFLATVPKTALLGLVLRYAPALGTQSLAILLASMAAASMVIGNILALRQRNLKRLLGYSSTAHVGYVLVAVVAVGDFAAEAVTFYMVSYTLANVGAFSVLALLSEGNSERDSIADLRGLFWQDPWLAGALATMLVSLAGLPLTVGFIGKYYLIIAGVASAWWSLVLILLATSVLGLYYYLRVIAALFDVEADTSAPNRRVRAASFGWPGALAAAVTFFVVLSQGVVPSGLIELIRGAIASSGPPAMLAEGGSPWDVPARDEASGSVIAGAGRTP